VKKNFGDSAKEIFGQLHRGWRKYVNGMTC